ncbi:hypothetical protein A0H81_00816 [Grifola frondosa]|uniref:Uncharacterized protein n=1 Tax=Grifola frondosa TaxID=5627 RepID=A0A1C7MUL8_GRIFR|nr:hypothetical protein A0H81_00816 [Grifola frondosa]
MAPRRKLNLTSHHSIKRTVFTFLGMHPTFQPSPTTLFFLLRSLRSTSKCGDRAGALVGQFVARWGSEIVDDRVRRRYASLLIKQSKLRAAATVDLAQQHVEALREEWRTEKEVRVGERNAERRRHLRWLDMGRTPRRNLEKWCWRLLRRRLWRTWNKGRSTLVDK